jgi:hypothetical protein
MEAYESPRGTRLQVYLVQWDEYPEDPEAIKAFEALHRELLREDWFTPSKEWVHVGPTPPVETFPGQIWVDTSKNAGQSVGTGKAEKQLSTIVEPKQGDPVRVWIDYYHTKKEAGYKVTFRDLAEKSGYSEGTFKNAHEGCERESCKQRRRTK